MSGPDVLRFTDVVKSFPRTGTVLRGLSAVLSTRVVTFVAGASGEGKSVLCRLAVGLLRPDSGTVELFGEPVHRLPERALRRLRQSAPYLVQGPALLDWRTVGDNVALAAPHATAAQVRSALARVGLEAAFDALPTTLGPGGQKRVAIARALMLEPRYLLLDEPTTGLDRRAAAQVANVLHALKRDGLGALVVSHDYALLEALADEVLVVGQGRSVFQGTAKDFLTAPVPELQALTAPYREA